MDEWSAGEITAFIAGVGTLITVIIGALFSDKVIAAFKARAEWKSQEAQRLREEKEKNRRLDEKGYQQVRRILDERIDELTERCDKLVEDHTDCQVKLAALTTKYELLASDHVAMAARVKKLENHGN